MRCNMTGFKDGGQVIVPVLLEFTGVPRQSIHNASARSLVLEEANST
jgi:hypothetical protein